jgi:hypothetical protein
VAARARRRCSSRRSPPWWAVSSKNESCVEMRVCRSLAMDVGSTQRLETQKKNIAADAGVLTVEGGKGDLARGEQDELGATEAVLECQGTV